jgi:hypothetical protein
MKCVDTVFFKKTRPYLERVVAKWFNEMPVLPVKS